MHKLYLHDIHKSDGANFIHMKQSVIELNAINHHIGLLDRSYLGKVIITGSDAIDLLNRISTNDLQYLAVGTMCDTVFVTPKGRMIDYCRVINTGDSLILICSFFHTNHLIEWINRFIILEDVIVRDASEDYIWMTLMGPRAKIYLGAFYEKPITDKDEAIWLDVLDKSFPVLKNSNFKVPAYNFCIHQEASKEIITSLLSHLRTLNGRLVGDYAFQIIRVESGMPDWGSEITQDYNPHEARLTHAISFTKGCYTGQEVIARLDTYDKVQKYLMIIELSKKIAARPPLEIYIDDESIGHLTSYAYDPINNRSIGLGYIKKMYAREEEIYVEIQIKRIRVPAKLRLPPQAYY
jgi:folate-binding protein YgfZ